MNIFRRLFGRAPDCNRGTLHLLPDDRFIVGLPFGTADDVAESVYQGVQRWIDAGKIGSVVFPYPVDVIDLRPR